MPLRRVIAVVAGLVLLTLVAASSLLLLRDDGVAVTGELIAYNCKEQGNRWYAICVVGVDGKNQHALTEGVATTDPSWSPDGRAIAFTRHETSGEFSRLTEDALYVMDADGSNLEQVTRQVPGESSFDPTWSPDGEELAFLRSDDVAAESPTRFGRLTIVSLDGSRTRSVGSGELTADPDWSPDGREVAVTVGTLGRGLLPIPNTDIYLVDVRTGARRRLTTTPRFYEGSPAWSPDGSRVAFARWQASTPFDGRSSIHVVRREGTASTLVLVHRHYSSGPFNLDWSPDGQSILFETSPVIGCTAISIVEVESRSVRPLTSCSRPVESTLGPDWQPSGR